MNEPSVVWQPTSEPELAAAATVGVLDEGGTGLELKRELASGDAANKELARDVASLAVSGGILLVGIADAKDRDRSNPLSALHPIPLAGIAERVEQIALTRCDPPLFVRCVAIPSEGDPDVGYLSVQVPPSSVAPHMVEGKYWGRGDRTKRQLTDSDVVALHDRRRLLNRDASETLDSYIARDPLVEAGIEPTLAHLFVVALPRPGRPTMLLDAVPQHGQWQKWLLSLIRRRANLYPPFGSKWAPDFGDATNCTTRSDGWAASCYDLQAGRQLASADREDHLLEIELSEDGEVRVFCGRASAVADPGRAPDVAVLFDVLIAGLVYRSVQLAADVAAETGYLGDWAIGVAVVGAKGGGSWIRTQDFMTTATPYPADIYTQLTRSSTLELQDRAGLVTDRLVGRMLRTLGTHDAPQLAHYLGRD
ncbi:MAG TPA: ATP-binding protein [Acidimicrobiia bacterium]|nr:ATP-binding protein [Acidimicrobiia bacterium]